MASTLNNWKNHTPRKKHKAGKIYQGNKGGRKNEGAVRPGTKSKGAAVAPKLEL